MALVLKDRVKGWTDSYGEDNFVIFATTNGYQSFSVIGNGNQTYYTVFDPTNYDWEVGIGTYTAATTTLSRDTILSSSNNNLIVSFLPGTKELFVGYPAEKAVTLDTPQTITDKTLVNATVTSGTINNTTIGATTPASGAFTTLVASGASLTSVNAGVALLTSATVTTLNATGASIASANIGNLQFTAASIASINAGVAVITNLSATSASIASMNAGVALLTTATVTTLNATGASIASANIGNLQFTAASIASINAGVAVITNLTATGASIASANVGTAVVTGLTVTNASIASLNAGTATVTTGNLTFSSTSQRITGDMSNATLASRLSFQSSTTNGVTSVQLIPNGTATTSNIRLFNGTDTANSANATLQVSSAETTLTSGITGTGTYLPMTFYTNGSERMRLDTSGNLGIGTTPSFLFDAYNSSTAVDYVAGRFYSAAAASGESRTWLKLEKAANYGGAVGGYLSQGVGSGLIFGTQNNASTPTERMRIDNNGNVGIGTTSPSQKLDVAGTSRYTFNVGNAYTLQTSINAAGSAFADDYKNALSHIWQTSGSERMRIDSSGNVGIGGTAGADTKLNISGTLPSSGTVSRTLFTNVTVPSGTTAEANGFQTSISTQAASFTLGSLYHFHAVQSAIGAGSAVTNQYGFAVNSGLTGATNNFGFYSNIASGSNRWNFYAAGTAQNYMAGRLGIGNTTFVDSEMLRITQASAKQALFIDITAASSTANAAISIRKYDNDNTTAQTYVAFAYNNGASGAGGIQGNGGTGPQFFNSSDARLKENVADLDGQLAKITALKPRTFDFINGPKNVTGFIAQEMEQVYPDVVGVDKDGYKTIGGVSIMEARLIKAIQELSAKVAALEAK